MTLAMPWDGVGSMYLRMIPVQHHLRAFNGTQKLKRPFQIGGIVCDQLAADAVPVDGYQCNHNAHAILSRKGRPAFAMIELAFAQRQADEIKRRHKKQGFFP